MKSCDVRDAKTIWAAAALIDGATLAFTFAFPSSGNAVSLECCVEGECVGDMDGETGRALSGAKIVGGAGRDVECQQAARCRIWNVSI